MREREPGDRHTIFLANCTPDLDRDRATLRRYLEDKGYRIVPTINYTPREEYVHQLLAESILFVAIVGPFRHKPTKHFRPTTKFGNWNRPVSLRSTF